MRKLFVTALMLCVGLVGLGSGCDCQAQYFLRGSFNGFDTSLPMNQIAPGVFEAIATGLDPGQKYNFLAADEGYSIQSGAAFQDVAVRANAAGQIRARFYENPDPADGWRPNLRRLGVFDLDYSYELMGSFNGYSAPISLSQVGGILQGLLTLNPNENYSMLFRQVGDWGITIKENFGDGGPDISFTSGNATDYFVRLDLANGRYQFVAVPEPTAVFGLTLLGIGMVARRRKA
jgi:hypothetical protein